MRLRRFIGLVLALSLAPACVHAPPQLPPEAKVGFHARRVQAGIDALQMLAIDAEETGVISTNDARVVVKATVEASKVTRLLAVALQAGYTEADLQRKLTLKLRAILQELPSQLSGKSYDLLNPYIQGILAVITLMGY